MVDGSAPARSTGGGVHRRWLLVSGVALLAVLLDQLTKWWALTNLQDRDIPLFWTLQLNLQRNTGAAFSVGRGTDWGRFLPILALLVVGYVIWQGRTVATKTGAVAIGMIVGGAIGNLLDRAFRTNGGGFFSGGVVDFIDAQWWPVFNVADSFVVVGGILLVLVSLRLPAEADDAGDADPEDDHDTDDSRADGARAAG